MIGQISRLAKAQSEGVCTRCQMVCIDQSTGEKTREPLHTIAASFQGKMRFGMYFSHHNETHTFNITSHLEDCKIVIQVKVWDSLPLKLLVQRLSRKLVEARSFIAVKCTACWDRREEGVIDHLRGSGRLTPPSELAECRLQLIMKNRPVKCDIIEWHGPPTNLTASLLMGPESFHEVSKTLTLQNYGVAKSTRQEPKPHFTSEEWPSVEECDCGTSAEDKQ
uniref:MOSC domain-containing protein n=1 Tax=Timema cristinae TaxID=61476 RepID=A0A7R9CGF4_TIMCR|nr:unnamed protein product [Timema cristinae]